MTLTDADIQHFYDHGWVKLEEAFPHQQTLEAQDAIWEFMREKGFDVYRDQPAGWTEPLIHIKDSFRDPRTDALLNERWREAVEDLVGKGRWVMRDQPMSFGWWPVNFINPEIKQWTVPKVGWHWDGQHFHHHVDAPEQGLLMIALFSDIESQGGATCVLENSHHLVARYLQACEPDGVALSDGVKAVRDENPQMRLLAGLDEMPDEERNKYFMEDGWVDEQSGKRIKVIEATGKAGDIYLLHPFMFHSRSDKVLGEPRFICNWTAQLNQRMCFERSDGDCSPLEIATRMALGQTA